MLAVVEEKEHRFVLEIAAHAVEGGPVVHLLEPERLRYRRRNECRITEGSERYEAPPVGESLFDLARDVNGKARLADPTRTGHRQQRQIGMQQELPNLRHFSLAADERR